MADSAKDWKGFTKNNLRVYTVLGSFMQGGSLASILFILFCGCSTAPVQDRPVHDRLDAYELAFHLYFREERKENAIDLLSWACRSLEDGRYISCYDLGQLLLREGRKDDAARAFAESYRISPNGPALSALYDLWATGTGPTPPPAPALVVISKTVERFCRAGDRQAAMIALKSSPADIPRELFAQPFFQECLFNQPEYAPFIAGRTPRPVPIDEIYRQRAAVHPLHAVLDVAPYLKAEYLAFESNHPVNVSWKLFLNAVRARNQVAAESALANFYAALEKQRVPGGAADSQILAMKRAAGTLIAGDIFFASIRGSPRIQKMVRDTLPGSGIFASK